MNNTINEFNEEFEDIINHVWSIYTSTPFVPKPYLHKLHSRIQTIASQYSPTSFTLEKSDLIQELGLIWHKLREEYYTTQKRFVSLVDFLVRKSIHGISVWFGQQLRTTRTSASICDHHTDATHYFKLDFTFIGNQELPRLFETLSSYEKYLLFLRYSQDKSLVEIAKITQCHRESVATRFEEIFVKLRSQLSLLPHVVSG